MFVIIGRYHDIAAQLCFSNRAHCYKGRLTSAMAFSSPVSNEDEEKRMIELFIHSIYLFAAQWENYIYTRRNRETVSGKGA